MPLVELKVFMNIKISSKKLSKRKFKYRTDFGIFSATKFCMISSSTVLNNLARNFWQQSASKCVVNFRKLRQIELNCLILITFNCLMRLPHRNISTHGSNTLKKITQKRIIPDKTYRLLIPGFVCNLKWDPLDKWIFYVRRN